jgi:hypothetical protein
MFHFFQCSVCLQMLSISVKHEKHQRSCNSSTKVLRLEKYQVRVQADICTNEIGLKTVE